VVAAAVVEAVPIRLRVRNTEQEAVVVVQQIPPVVVVTCLLAITAIKMWSPVVG
jgi:hypothetical protein